MVDWSGKEAYENDVHNYFLCCPLCGSDSVNVSVISVTSGGRDSASCDSCGAKWHLYIGTRGLSWAELELSAKDGGGKELIGKRLKKDEWKRMAQKARLSIKKEENRKDQVKEREVIREKEVIVKIRCPYCKNLYEETLNNCPHCGAKT